MLHISKISITTHFTRHVALTTDQAHHGHGQSVLRYSLPKRKVIRQEANRVIALNAHDCVPNDQGQREQVGYAVLSSWGERLIPSFGVFGQGKEGCIGKLGVQVCDSFVDGRDCARAFQLGYHWCWCDYAWEGRGWREDQLNCWCYDWNRQVLPEVINQNEISLSLIFGQNFHQTWHPKASNSPQLH